MLNFAEIECVGCTACSSVCPQNIINIKRNIEGFQYPYIDDVAKCIECDMCNLVCPVINVKPEVKHEQVGAIVQITDDQIRKESASGGMFSAIAIAVLQEKGIVYGAAYNESFEVCHIGISNLQDLWKLRNSKYVQSNLVGVFEEVKQALDADRLVCFSGTPCQIEGLKCYLRKEYQNLLLVDVVCHGVSSPLIWEKYIETVREYRPKNIYFRWKHYGYKYSTMSIFNQNGEEAYYGGVESDGMLRAYFSNSCDRESCYGCVFKKRYRESDITIWDCFQPAIFNKEFDDDRGTSGVLVHSAKGETWIKKIIDSNLIRYQFVQPDNLVFGNIEMVSSVSRGPLRDRLLIDAGVMTGKELFSKYFPDSISIKIKRTGRIILIRIGLYKHIKHWIFKYRRSKI